MSALTTIAENFILTDPALAGEVARILGERAMRGLTPTQKKLHDYIRVHIAKEGVAPTLTEMASHMGLASKGRIHRLLIELEERGTILRTPYLSRAISIVGQAA
jgi:SOS-response transcriptional repressor LexA